MSNSQSEMIVGRQRICAPESAPHSGTYAHLAADEFDNLVDVFRILAQWEAEGIIQKRLDAQREALELKRSGRM